MTHASRLTVLLLLFSLLSFNSFAEESKGKGVPDKIYSASMSKWFLGLGINRGVNHGSNLAYASMTFGYQWRLDDEYEFRILSDNAYGTGGLRGSRDIFAGVGLNYFFTDEHFAWLMGLEIGVQSTSIVYQGIDSSLAPSVYQREDSSSLAGAVKIGRRFYTRSALPFEVDLRAAQSFSTNRFGSPQLFGLSISIFL
jgi:hypothetical protein